MSDLSDLLLLRPLADGWARFLMFSIFYVHLALALVLIGTFMLGVAQLWSWFLGSEREWPPWGKDILERFVAPKALAVVIGVGVLLVVQLYFAVPFYTAVAIWGGFWIANFIVMIVSFLSADVAAHKLHKYPTMALVVGTLGLVVFFFVPATFVLVLVTTESIDHWPAIANRGYQLDWDLAIHWLFRFLHVIGAGVVFGAAFQLLLTAEDRAERKRTLVRWVLVGLLAQIVIGGALTLTIQEWLELWSVIPLVAGIGAAVAIIWLLFVRAAAAGTQAPRLGVALYLLPVVLLGMLLARQFIQQQKVLPVLEEFEAAAVQQSQLLEHYDLQAMASYQARLAIVYDDGGTIFRQACTFCHGYDGSGNGPDGLTLAVRPERVAEIRATPAYFSNVLPRGVPGSAMPYFAIFDEWKREDLVRYLDERFGVLAAPEPVPFPLTDELRAEAERTFNGTCALCHGLDGRVSDYAAGRFSPAPPDFTRFGLTPQRAMEVVRDGYPGTAMQPFGELPEGLRWGLVDKVASFRAE